MIQEMTTTVCQYNLPLYNSNSDMEKPQDKVFHEKEVWEKHFKNELNINSHSVTKTNLEQTMQDVMAALNLLRRIVSLCPNGEPPAPEDEFIGMWRKAIDPKSNTVSSHSGLQTAKV